MSDSTTGTVVVATDPALKTGRTLQIVATVVGIIALVSVIPMVVLLVVAAATADLNLVFESIVPLIPAFVVAIVAVIVLAVSLSGRRRRVAGEQQALYAAVANAGHGPVDAARLYTGQPTTTPTGHWLRMTRTNEQMTVSLEQPSR